MSDNQPSGLQVRREVMGDAFVDRALGNATAFSQPLQDFVNEHAWGGVWNREGLDRRTRSLITLSALTALKCNQEIINMHCSIIVSEKFQSAFLLWLLDCFHFHILKRKS